MSTDLPGTPDRADPAEPTPPEPGRRPDPDPAPWHDPGPPVRKVALPPDSPSTGIPVENPELPHPEP
jgi:hypothetical protein